jgi:hypothetical protein
MAAPPSPYELPWPLAEVDQMEHPPTAIDLHNVLRPLLEQCESLAASLLVSLEHGEYPTDAGPYVPHAHVLREYLRLARQIFLAWAAHQGGSPT